MVKLSQSTSQSNEIKLKKPMKQDQTIKEYICNHKYIDPSFADNLIVHTFC